MIDLKTHLTELCEAHGPSGYEAGVREIVRQTWEGLADELHTDTLGSLIATRHGTGPEPRRRILITTHMDELGLIVTKLDGAFLRVDEVGGVDVRVLLSQPVLVHAQDGPIPGIIGSRPPHVLPAEERKRYPAMHELVVDTGLSERQLSQRIRVGDVITFDQPMTPLKNGCMAGKALDNRASVAALTLCLQELTTREHRWDVVAAATVQEEETLGGGKTVAWRIKPDLAIVVDVTFGVGSSVSESDGAFKLGEGPTLAIGPTFHPRLFEMIQETAKAIEVALTVEPVERAGGTEAFAVQVSRDGIPTALLSVPLRNMHSPVEVVALRDIERAGRLMAGFSAGLDDATLDKLTLEES